MPAGMPSEADKKALHDYYRVLNVILTVGVVMEIMIVPPVIDRKQGLQHQIKCSHLPFQVSLF